MASAYKKELNLLIVKIIALIVFVLIALKSFKLVGNASGYDAVYLVPFFTFWLLLIGLVLWDLFGDQISEQISSFILQTGGKISKPKYYSKARSLVMQNKFEDAIKLYQKILNEDNTDVIAYSEMGDIYHEKLKDYSTAFNCYDKIEQYAQESSDIIFAINRKVDIYLTDKNYPNPEPSLLWFMAKAIEELKKITKRFPKTKDAARAEERIKKLEELLEKQKKPEVKNV